MAAEAAFAAIMIQTTLVGVKPTVRIPSAIAALSLPYWRRRLSRDVHSICHHSHGTACGASMANIRAHRGMYAYGRLNFLPRFVSSLAQDCTT